MENSHQKQKHKTSLTSNKSQYDSIKNANYKNLLAYL